VSVHIDLLLRVYNKVVIFYTGLVISFRVILKKIEAKIEEW
jgi:hypothetical protein